MKQTSKLNRTAVILSCITVVLFFSFFLYMSTAERVSVFHAEQTHTYSLLEGMEREIISDLSAPAGIHKVYRGVLDPAQSMESCLCFNIAHHSIQVYFDDALVYSLSPQDTNLIGKNVSSNWCSVHVGQAHAGKSVTVVLTPLMEAVTDKEPAFILGSHYAIAMDVIVGELPLLILSSLCVLLGVFLVVIFLYFQLVQKVDSVRIAYLGLFSIVLGIWKITDLRCMPLMFPDNSLAFGYVSVGCLFMTGMSLMLYFSTLFTENMRGVPLLLACCSAVVCLFVLAAQLLGISEIRQNLIFSHILLILSAAAIPLAVVYNRIVTKTWGILLSWRLLLLLFLGIAIDLFLYYRNNGNGLMSFSISGFIVYSMIIFFSTIQDSTRKAYTDARTGLANRTRWNELMDEDLAIPEPFGILMVDLNGLKQINDTLGHDAGDQIIFHFSSILRNTLPRSSVICRWGGDEFAILLPKTDREKVDRQMASLSAAVEKYNAENRDLAIHFAIGTALSTEHAGISRKALFQLADEEMYRNKQSCYAHR